MRSTGAPGQAACQQHSHREIARTRPSHQTRSGLPSTGATGQALADAAPAPALWRHSSVISASPPRPSGPPRCASLSCRPLRHRPAARLPRQDHHPSRRRGWHTLEQLRPRRPRAASRRRATTRLIPRRTSIDLGSSSRSTQHTLGARPAGLVAKADPHADHPTGTIHVGLYWEHPIAPGRREPEHAGATDIDLATAELGRTDLRHDLVVVRVRPDLAPQPAPVWQPSAPPPAHDAPRPQAADRSSRGRLRAADPQPGRPQPRRRHDPRTRHRQGRPATPHVPRHPAPGRRRGGAAPSQPRRPPPRALPQQGPPGSGSRRSPTAGPRHRRSPARSRVTGNAPCAATGTATVHTPSTMKSPPP